LSARTPRRRATPSVSGPLELSDFPAPSAHLKKSDTSNFSTIDLPDENAIEASFSALPPQVGPGCSVGPFKIVEELGRGRTTTVFRAYSPIQDRVQAVKVLRPDFDVDDDIVLAFRREADLAARVSHAGIVPAHPWEFDSGYHFYSMNVMDDPALSEFIQNAFGKRGDLFFKEVAELFADLCRAVAELHAARIVHQDIKPTNLFLDPGSRLILGDFAAAREMGDQVTKATAKSHEDHVGTHAYMGPERFVQSPTHRTLDIRSDIYSLGMSLYELLTGVLPFPECDPADMVRFKLTRKPPSPRQQLPETPLGLEAIVRQALDVQLELRYQTAADMAKDLDRFASQRRTGTRNHPSEKPPQEISNLGDRDDLNDGLDDDTFDGPDPEPAKIC
jgi:serine/threonine protein kinase